MAKRRANGEGNIRKRKDGRWEGRYTAGTDPVTGKAIVRNVLGKTQAEVKEKLKKAIAESGELDIKRSGLYTVGEWMDLWYEVYAKPRIRESTAVYYKMFIDTHIRPKLGDIKLNQHFLENKATMADAEWQFMPCIFGADYKGEVPISRRNRNYMGWMMGLVCVFALGENRGSARSSPGGQPAPGRPD